MVQLKHKSIPGVEPATSRIETHTVKRKYLQPEYSGLGLGKNIRAEGPVMD
jgi:hypothetical protein